MIRFIHTADWHLGRIFHGVHLTDDQAYVLEQFVRLAVDAKPDAIIISGDIYDRAVPPPLAIKLLNEVLSGIIIDLKVPVIIIAGNHDSSERLGFASRLLSQQGLFIFGQVSKDISPVLIMDKEWGLSARIYALPYLDPPLVREYLQDDTVSDHSTATQALLNAVQNIHPPDECAIIISHAFIAGGRVSESERPLSIGGAGAVDASLFKDFDYAAMGHLHRPQSVGYEAIQYAGSLLKYSFSEADHIKSVNLVEMDYHGVSRLERIPLVPRHDVRIVEGYIKDILKGSFNAPGKEDYLLVRLLDRGAVLDAMGRLREVYPNVLHIERPSLTVEGGDPTGPGIDPAKMTDLELFQSFFVQTTGEELTKDQSAAFASIAGDIRRLERDISL